MRDGGVREKFYEFLEEAHCAFGGSRSSGRMSGLGVIAEILPGETPDATGVRLTEREVGILDLIGPAFHAAGIEFDWDKQAHGDRSIVVDLSRPGMHKHLDEAISRLADARTDYVLDNMAALATLRAKRQLRDDVGAGHGARMTPVEWIAKHGPC